MTTVIRCSCVKLDNEYKWICSVGDKEVYVDAIREFHMRENWLVCSEHEYKNGYITTYINPKIVRIYSKKENVRILEVWV